MSSFLVLFFSTSKSRIFGTSEEQQHLFLFCFLYSVILPAQHSALKSLKTSTTTTTTKSLVYVQVNQVLVLT